MRVSVAKSIPWDESPSSGQSEYLAILRGDVETELSFKVGGVLQLIGRDGQAGDWREGSSIGRGELLARLDQEDFKNSVKSARARAVADRQQYLREQQLRDSGAVSQQEFEAATAAKESSEAALAQAEQALKDSVLLAPYDAVLTQRLANNGETISAGRGVLKIADMREMSVELGVPDRLIAKVHVGMELPVKVSALDDSVFIGRVSEVGVAARDEARLFTVIIKLKNPEGVLKAGMTASVVFGKSDAVKSGSVLIPLSALLGAPNSSVSNQLAAFVIDADGKAHERILQTDDFVRNSVIVTKGLKPGDRVVTSGASTLYEGAEVEVREQENP